MKPVVLDRETRTEADDSELSDMVRYCVDLYDEFRDSEYRRDKLDEIAEGRRRLKGIRPEKTFPFKGCSDKSMKLERITVEHLDPRLMAQLVSDADFLTAEPVDAEDSKSVEDVQKFLKWMANNSMHLKSELRPIVHDLLVDGTVDVIPVWHEREVIRKARRTVPVLRLADGEVPVPPEIMARPEFAMMQQSGMIGMADIREERTAIRFRTKLEQVALEDAFFPDNWDNWDNAPYMRLIYPTIYELRALSEENGGPYFDITDDLASESARDRELPDEEIEDLEIEYSAYSKEVKLLECYIKWKGEEWRIVTIAIDAGYREVRNQPLSEVYPFEGKPVFRLSIYKETRESLGTGIPKLIEDYSTGVDDIYNIMIDQGILDVTDAGFISEGLGTIPTDSLTISPGKWRTLPKDAVPHPASKTGVQSAHFINFISLLMGFLERLTSLMDAILPGNPGGTRAGGGTETYSGMALISSESQITHSYRGESVREVVEQLVKACFQIYAWYIPADAKMRIFHDNQWIFKTVDVEALQGEYDIRIKVSDSGSNKMLARREAAERYQLFQANPNVDPIAITRDLIAAYGIYEPDKYINPNSAVMVKLLKQNPELIQVAQKYLQGKQEQQKAKLLADQARQNVTRTQFYRTAEKNSGTEDQKLQDQVVESAKKKLIRPVIERAMGVPQNE